MFNMVTENLGSKVYDPQEDIVVDMSVPSVEWRVVHLATLYSWDAVFRGRYANEF